MVSYDEIKRQANIEKHGFDFLGCEAVFEGFTITREDQRDAYGELHLQTLGLWKGIVVFVVHTARGDVDHVILETAADRLLPLQHLVNIAFFALNAFTLSVRALRTRLSCPGARWTALLCLAGTSLPRCRALPAHPMTAHSAASNCRF